MKNKPATDNQTSSARMLAMNEALVLGSLRQHELTEIAENLNVRLQLENAERKHAEETMRVSEIRYRRLFEAAQDGVLLLDPHTCQITEANPFMTRLLGYPHDQLVGKQLFEIGLLKDEVASRVMFETLKRNHQVRYDDLPLQNQSGELLEVEVVANFYKESGHHVIQCNIRDITDRKLAEDNLRRNEALFSSLIELAPMGVYVVDARFRLQRINPNALPAFSNHHPLIGRDFSEIIHLIWPKSAADALIACFRHTLETGEFYQSPQFTEQRQDIGIQEVYEWQIQRVTLPTGEYGVVCFFNNITERKNFEAAQRHLDVLTASNEKLKKEIVLRMAVEESLRQTQQEQILLLDQSRTQELQLRDFSRRILHTQEEERKRISRELHDVISQNLLGINLHMTALATEDLALLDALQQKIAGTQRLVEETVNMVHQFALDLRPSALDDLGLIPALHALFEKFMRDTGIRSTLTAFAGIEKCAEDLRTALFRIAQEALNNVARHAGAENVSASIKTVKGVIRMEITDDGAGFDVATTSKAAKSERLGLIGMRERIEMVGGTFQVKSVPGRGTTVRVELVKPN